MIFIVKNIRLEEHSYLYLLIFDTDCFLNLETVAQNLRLGKNVQIGIDQKVYEWPVYSFAKMIHSWGNHFGKRTDWSLIYFLIYACLNILAQSQILSNSL